MTTVTVYATVENTPTTNLRKGYFTHEIHRLIRWVSSPFPIHKKIQREAEKTVTHMYRSGLSTHSGQVKYVVMADPATEIATTVPYSFQSDFFIR
jgi:hypothetical protein